MVYDTLISLIKKKVFIVFQDSYSNSSHCNNIERFVAKHPLLKPEIMMVDDQPFGFKTISKSVMGLEKFPIYFEIEFEQDEYHEKHINSLEVYSEVDIKVSDKLDKIKELSTLYQKTVAVDYIKRLADPDMELLCIYSKISELFEDGDLEQDIADGLLTEKELLVMFDIQLTSLLNFIKLSDDMLTKGLDVSLLHQPEDIL